MNQTIEAQKKHYSAEEMRGAVVIFQVFNDENGDDNQDNWKNIAHLAKTDSQQRVNKLAGDPGHGKEA